MKQGFGNPLKNFVRSCGSKRNKLYDCTIRRIRVSHKYPPGIEPGSLMMGSKRVIHWTSETMYECGEIAGSAQSYHLLAAFQNTITI
jgi:hypothetical protein